MTAKPEGGVAGVVLAAGGSTRMGENKLFLRLGGATVLRRAVTTAVAGGLDPVLVVVGHDSERTCAEVMDLRCAPVLNPEYSSGIHSSLRTGISAVPAGCAAAVVLLADMPFVTAEMVRALVEGFQRAGTRLVLSVYGDVLAPPTLYSRSLFAELLALEGAGCGRRIMRRHRDAALEVTWPVERLADLDVPADVTRIRERLEGG